MTRMRRIVCVAMLGAAAACSPPRQANTRLDSVDLVAMTDRMAMSLLASDMLAGRDEQSPRWVVSVDRVTNRTSDVIPHRELWAFMARLRALLNQSPELRRRNVVFVLSPDQAAALNQRQGDDAGARARPTHVLAATFRSLTQDTRTVRSDTYLCAFQFIDLASDEIRWEDSYEVKRTVLRDEWD